MKFRGFWYHETVDNPANTTVTQLQISTSQGSWETSIYHADTQTCVIIHCVVFARDAGSFWGLHCFSDLVRFWLHANAYESALARHAAHVRRTCRDVK